MDAARRTVDMMIAHLFLRKEKRKRYVMCHTSGTDGVGSIYPTPEHMFELYPGDTMEDIEKRVVSRVLAEHPELEFSERSRTGSENGGPLPFDLIFRAKKGINMLKWIGVVK